MYGWDGSDDDYGYCYVQNNKVLEFDSRGNLKFGYEVRKEAYLYTVDRLDNIDLNQIFILRFFLNHYFFNKNGINFNCFFNKTIYRINKYPQYNCTSMSKLIYQTSDFLKMPNVEPLNNNFFCENLKSPKNIFYWGFNKLYFECFYRPYPNFNVYLIFVFNKFDCVFYETNLGTLW
jgi:hypothetical protein